MPGNQESKGGVGFSLFVIPADAGIHKLRCPDADGFGGVAGGMG